MSGFRKYLTVLVIGDASDGLVIRWRGVAILSLKCSARQSGGPHCHQVPEYTSYCAVVDEEQESFRWCLRNAVELLEFTRGYLMARG